MVCLTGWEKNILTALRQTLTELVNLFAMLHEASRFLEVFLINEGILVRGVASEQLIIFVISDSVSNQP